ncbi:MAG TPA: acyltransferase [Candidatus Binatia bacterium]|nr:acyltransferase [Candidatus Binatia bacterium]
MFRRLLLLNGLSILGVVLFHASGWGFVAMFGWAERYASFVPPNYAPTNTLSYAALRVMEQAAVFSIPAFLFVSGVFIAFAAGRQGKTISWHVVRARIRSLIIPYLLWSALLLSLDAAQGHVLSPLNYLLALLTGQANPAYYYVPLIIQFYALSPYLVPLARKHARALLVVTAIIQLTVQLLYYPDFTNLELPLVLVPKWLFVTRVFWFSAGIVAGFNLKFLESRLPRWRWPLLVGALLLLVIGVVEWQAITNAAGGWVDHRETFVDTLYSLVVILTVLAFFQHKHRFADALDDLGAHSFGVYLVHSPVMEYAIRIIYHVAPLFLAYQVILQPLLILLGLGVPLGLMAVTNRTSVRRFYKLGFG